MAKPNNVIVDDSSPNSRRDCHDDFGFVFIEKNYEYNVIDDDADSYDYCEDVCSIISDGNRQEHDGDTYVSSEGLDDCNTSRFSCLKDSALSVPLVLLKELDEAHEAAKLTQISNLDGVTDLITTCSDDEYVVEADEKNTTLSPSPKDFSLEETEDEKADKLEHSRMPSSSGLNKNNDDLPSIDDSSLELSTKVKEPSCVSRTNGDSAIKNAAIVVLPVITTGKKQTSNDATATTPCFIISNTKISQEIKKQNEKPSSNGDKKGATDTSNKTTSVPVSISRASNKKRRKRLKLLKKAQAAEKFKQQAAFANLAPPLQGKMSKKLLKHSKNQLQVSPSRRASKKVANIAVSCAIDSISSYRKELCRQHGKQ